MKKIFIFGNKGNMGRRYASILKYLGYAAYGIDKNETYSSKNIKDYDGYIIATDTASHLSILDFFIDCNKPVLCEKPIVTGDMIKLQHFIKQAEASKMQLSMVSQYDFLEDPTSGDGDTSYDFYRSGNDGIAWDCINLIWHARGKIILKNESPIWECQINGMNIDPRDIDYSYLEMIRWWLIHDYEPQYERIIKSHQKVMDYIDGKFN